VWWVFTPSDEVKISYDGTGQIGTSAAPLGRGDGTPHARNGCALVLQAINVDKGDHVKEGQVIAIIESPETDKQVSDARSYYWLQAVTESPIPSTCSPAGCSATDGRRFACRDGASQGCVRKTTRLATV